MPYPILAQRCLSYGNQLFVLPWKTDDWSGVKKSEILLRDLSCAFQRLGVRVHHEKKLSRQNFSDIMHHIVYLKFYWKSIDSKLETS